jgi:glycosyltransferase involved in cell wall biosynthesis
VRVIVVTDQYPPMVGGVPTVTSTLAHGLARRGHAVALVGPAPGPAGRPGPGSRPDLTAPLDPGAPLDLDAPLDPDSPLDPGGRLTVHLRGSIRWPWYDGMRLAAVPGAAGRRLLAGFGPDVIHIHSPATLGVTALAAARRLRIPVVYTNHYLPVNVRPARQHPPRLAEAAFYSFVVGFANRCSLVTAPTGTALRLLRDRGLRVPSRVVSNGVDLARFRPGRPEPRIRDRYGLAAGRPVILSVGRLSAEKRLDVLLHAVARMARDAQLAVAGTGPAEAALRAAAARLGLAPRTRFLGHVPDADLPALYRTADVFAITSEAELQSLAALEAMACGLPVVAADACALRELVRHGRTGFLAAPGRSREVAGYLDLVLADPARRAAMAAAGRHAVAAHEQGHGLAAWEALYGRLARGGA